MLCRIVCPLAIRKGSFFLSSSLLPVSLNDSPQIKVCNAFATSVKKNPNASTLEDITKETLSGLTFAIRNGSVHALFRSRFQSPGEILIALYLDRRRPRTFSGRKEESNNSLHWAGRIPCPALRAWVLQESMV